MSGQKQLRRRIRELESQVSLLRLALLDTSRVSTRSALARLAKALQFIRAGEFPSATKIAESLGTSTKTIHGDLTFMRDSLRLPVYFDAKKNGWGMSRAVAFNFFDRDGPSDRLREQQLKEIIQAHNAKGTI